MHQERCKILTKIHITFMLIIYKECVSETKIPALKGAGHDSYLNFIHYFSEITVNDETEN